MIETLKPCPHCGSANVHLSHFDNSKVFCVSCFESNNALKWNARPREDALRAALIACVRQLRNTINPVEYGTPLKLTAHKSCIADAEKALNETEP